MHYKKLEHYIILRLIIQITLLLYVSGNPVNSEDITVFSHGQLHFLADNVCSNLEFFGVSLKRCLESFWASEYVLKPSPVKIRCQTTASIRFQVEPTENWQLVVLIPALANDSDSDMNFINYSLVEPNTEFETISTIARSNYIMWSAVLNVDAPLLWQGGDLVPQYNESMVPEHRGYDIKYQFHANAESNLVVNGRFMWNISGENDVCFDVANFCGEDGIKDKKVWPSKYKSDEAHVEFDKLSMGEECEILVTGMYGETRLKYRTPSCEHDCLSANTKPEHPQNVSIFASEDTFATWEVLVSWARPRLLPDQYNVTLRTNTIQTIVVPGDATEAVFKDVVGTGFYNVSIYTVLGKVASHTFRRALFPGRATVRGGRGTGAGAAAAAGLAAAAALALLLRCRRAPRHQHVPVYRPADKHSEDGETEVLEVWSESEDRWEVRTDKLVLHEVIGEGAFGVVRRATLAPHSVHVAVKMLKDFPSLEEVRSFRSEMELMKSVGVHPHLVSLVGCCSGRRPLIIAEYCSRGDLLSYLRCTWDVMLSKRNAKYYNNNIDTSDYRNDLFKCKAQMDNSKLVVNKLYELQDICDKELTALDLLSFCRQIAMGMEFLAANRVVHRDLAARNVLVTADRTLKIADFGLSRDVYEENQYKQKGNGKMPVKWMAIESLTRRIYTTQSDVWSFGVVVWEIATVGGAPYAGVPAARLPRLLRSGYRMPRPNNCSPQLYDIMLSCWRTYPRERPTFAELHERLDELLNSACANQYLSLQIDADDAPPTPKHHRYIKMLISRGKRNWSRGENYERPLTAPHTNHYTTPPDSLSANPA